MTGKTVCVRMNAVIILRVSLQTGAVVSYGFEASSQWQNLFRIDANSGIVFLRRRLISVTGNQFVVSIQLLLLLFHY